ncbi:MAG: hypothetical protein ACREHD_32510 [Pirellulales bacterium]
MPADLERRLLAAIPTHRSVAQRPSLTWRSLAWTGGCAALAAACLLAFLARSWSDAQRPAADRGTPRRLAPAPNTESHAIAWGRTRPIFDSSKPPKFAWPLAGVSSIAASSHVRDVPFD